MDVNNLTPAVTQALFGTRGHEMSPAEIAAALAPRRKELAEVIEGSIVERLAARVNPFTGLLGESRDFRDLGQVGEFREGEVTLMVRLWVTVTKDGRHGHAVGDVASGEARGFVKLFATPGWRDKGDHKDDPNSFAVEVNRDEHWEHTETKVLHIEDPRLQIVRNLKGPKGLRVGVHDLVAFVQVSEKAYQDLSSDTSRSILHCDAMRVWRHAPAFLPETQTGIVRRPVGAKRPEGFKRPSERIAEANAKAAAGSVQATPDEVTF